MEENESLVLQLLREVREEQKMLVIEVERFNERLDGYDAKCNHLMQAFPSEDMEGHRRYHESVIAWLEMRNSLVRDCLSNAAKVGSLGAFGWLLYALWQIFKMEFHK